MIAQSNLNSFKYNYGLRALALFGIYSSVSDLFYLDPMYLCGNGLNLCPDGHLYNALSNSFLIHALMIIKILSFISVLFLRKLRLALSLCLAIGFYFAFLNPFVFSPDIPYLNFLIIALLFSDLKKERFFQDVFPPFMSVIYLSYSFSGYYKLNTPRWINGSFLENFLVKNHLLVPWMDSVKIPALVLITLTYLTMYLEVFGFTAIIHRSFHLIVWSGLTVMHIGLLLITDLTQVSLAMLVIHLFLIDETIFESLSTIIRPLYSHLKSFKLFNQ